LYQDHLHIIIAPDGWLWQSTDLSTTLEVALMKIGIDNRTSMAKREINIDNNGTFLPEKSVSNDLFMAFS